MHLRLSQARQTAGIVLAAIDHRVDAIARTFGFLPLDFCFEKSVL
jgi:hypothetical protein